MSSIDPEQPEFGLPAEAVFAALLEAQSPVPVEKQVLVIYAATNGHMDTIEVKDILNFEGQLLKHFDLNHKAILDEIGNGKKMSNELQAKIKTVLEEFNKRFDPNAG